MTLKSVTYYCAGCRKRVHRQLPRALATYKSYCEKAGREIRMRKVKS